MTIHHNGSVVDSSIGRKAENLTCWRKTSKTHRIPRRPKPERPKRGGHANGQALRVTLDPSRHESICTKPPFSPPGYTCLEDSDRGRISRRRGTQVSVRQRLASHIVSSLTDISSPSERTEGQVVIEKHERSQRVGLQGARGCMLSRD